MARRKTSTSTIEHIQLWLHRNYKLVRLGLLLLILILLAFLTIRIVQAEFRLNREVTRIASEESRDREERMRRALAVLDERTDDIKRNSDKNTDLMICLLAIHGEFEEVTENDERDCRRIIADGAQQATPNSSSPNSSPSEDLQPEPEIAPSEPTPSPPPPPVDPPEDPSLIERLTDFITNPPLPDLL